MNILLIAVLSFVGYIIAYNTYGRWLSRKVFRLDPNAAVPSVQLRDDCDYVPTPKSIVFGHHFTSIAGTGPIVGPAIAVMWGWLPALLWVLFGSIFIGAVHDLGSLVVSLRSRGQTVGDIAGRVLNPRVRFLFLAVLFVALWLVLAIFGLVIAGVFMNFPASILPVFLQIPIAVWIGLTVHRKGGNILIPSIVALALMYLTVWFGAACPGLEWTGGHLGESIQKLNASLAGWPIWVWTAILLAYCYAASVMPVWVLLQPRDYINSLQLISALGLIVLGVGAAAFYGVDGKSVEIVAPAVRLNPVNAPPILPVLFVTIACGAISGFHCLVSSGTSSKQLRNETDAQFVGYGAMLTEGFLAILVILAVTAGIGMGWDDSPFAGLRGTELWNTIYADWKAADAGNTKVGAFVVGSANFLRALGIAPEMATALMGVLVASFAGTTLDTATRLQRYVIQELAAAGQEALPGGAGKLFQPFRNPHPATLLAVVTAFGLALFPGPGKPWTVATLGKGGLILWPMFGAMNQLLGGLAFMVICFWLWRRKQSVWFVALPAVFMLVMPAWAMVLQLQRDWVPNRSYLLIGLAVLTMALEFWMVIEAILLWPKVRGVAEPPARGTPAEAVCQPETALAGKS